MQATRPAAGGTRQSHRIVRYATAFVLLACLLLLAVDGWRTREARDTHIEQARVVGGNLSRSIAQHADDKIGEADTFLSGLVERLEVDGTHETALARLHKLLMSTALELPQLHGLFVYGEHGEWLVNSQPVLLTHFNNADRDYFRFHAAHPISSPYIGPPIQSRSTGDWIITVSRRFEHPDGRFAGVVLATLNMAYFNDYYRRFDLGESGYITLGLANGTLLARQPFNEELIGRSIDNRALFREHISVMRNGTVLQPAEGDTPDYIHAFRNLERYPLFVTVSQSRSEVLAAWRESATRHGVGIALLVATLAACGLLLVRQIGRRLDIEAELREARDALQGANLALERLAGEDGLTGIANRRRFDAALHAEFLRAARQHSPLALILADVDHFKPYNDIYGHPAGDECLQRVAALVADSAQHRASDLVARYGGEELAILLPGTDLAGAKIVAERVRRIVAEAGLKHAGSPIGHVTLSLGVHACIPHEDHEPQSLVDSADKALYAAKAGGRNRVASRLASLAA